MTATELPYSSIFRRVGIGLLLGSATLSVTACDGGERGMQTASPSASQEAPFDWPEDPSHPIVRIEIDGAVGPGVIEIELMPELAPKTVEQFIAWADEGFYDDTTFHRVIKDFMIQGGDPNTRDDIVTNDGLGGPGFSLEDEFSDAPFVRGVVGMGNKGRRDSAGSQFFIMQADAPHLDGDYTAIGRVRSGIEFVDAVANTEIDIVGRWGPASRPIESIEVSKVRTIDSAMARSVASEETEASDAKDGKAPGRVPAAGAPAAIKSADSKSAPEPDAQATPPAAPIP